MLNSPHAIVQRVNSCLSYIHVLRQEHVYVVGKRILYFYDLCEGMHNLVEVVFTETIVQTFFLSKKPGFPNKLLKMNSRTYYRYLSSFSFNFFFVGLEELSLDSIKLHTFVRYRIWSTQSIRRILLFHSDILLVLSYCTFDQTNLKNFPHASILFQT